MKIRLSKWGPLDFVCKGRQSKSNAPSSVCARVRSQGKGWGKVYYAEVFSTKSGKSLGFIGDNCTLVGSPEKAFQSDHWNKGTALMHLHSCLPRSGFGHHKAVNKAFMEAVRVAAKKK